MNKISSYSSLNLHGRCLLNITNLNCSYLLGLIYIYVSFLPSIYPSIHTPNIYLVLNMLQGLTRWHLVKNLPVNAGDTRTWD